MNALLISLAVEVGAPLIERFLSAKFGNATGSIARDVVNVIASRAGTSSEDLPDVARSDPERVKEAIRRAEGDMPDVLPLLISELEHNTQIAQIEYKGPWWTWGWRPAGMWGLGVLWFWSVIVLHIANAFFKIALPQPPYDILMGLTALYLTLYMGGHTVKDVAGKWLGTRK